ncbi:DUF3077 domain-containing protein [Pseudomonas putida]|jgi:hypothetical protein|uniref:DUF3077 domain-containing protein n=2 Tax=Pseudomonas putida group TaxID=136845 RepID=A0A178L689_9PSED|nr:MULTISPECIES: DUF3077 domain-containing protein [Pseudomonas]EGC00618.1 hypothetical protein G1E_02153 [Pseudomonas sp. TJI-51]EKY4192133.1 DUF3077 domain-containing protein [Pseudomonas aeruginosa]ELJ2354648.1 DUF3077 domain-containing protein [Pseudomonas aeruginosa]ELL1263936.1 DUF3077 domain-containing protein [Pseudomonas aeruginosa]ELT3994217.1 DUF3077 domain-containing protein [Pseudomonas aeruginosa]
MSALPEAEKATTADVTSFITNQNPPMDLFHISPGVPCDYALEQASTLLGCVHKLILAGAVDEDGDMIWAAYYLSGLAQAILADVEAGRMRNKREKTVLKA